MDALTLTGWQPLCFASLLAFAVTLYSNLATNQEFNIKTTQKVLSEYDFIVIGGGSAGSVIANRLSEERNLTVLLLEAGYEETVLTDIPYNAAQLQGTEFDWKYLAEPPVGDQQYCLAMVNQSCRYPRGKALGGSSVINYMLYVRGNRNDYDRWKSLGNKGWGYDDVLEYFKKSENNSNPKLLKTQFHSSSGYQSVQDITTTPLANIFLKGGEYLGYTTQDPNGKNQTGYAIPQGTIRNGSRCSVSKGFIALAPIQNRQNLYISIGSHVTKIHFKKTGNSKPRAASVSFVKNNQTHIVKARKEVILCAGAISSPQILMLSGIGPEPHLKELDIKTIKDLKVGFNFQDHVGSQLDFKVAEPVVELPAELHNPENLKEYFVKRKGPCTSIQGIQGTAFINTKYGPPSGLNPDIQFVIQSRSIYNSGAKHLGNVEYNFRPGLFKGSKHNNLQNDRLFLIHVIPLRPKSRGRVKLRSKDPYAHPIIDPNFFSEEEDMKVLIEGMQEALKLVATPPFKKVGATPLDIHFPGCEKHELYSDDYMECFARHFTVNFHHPVGTCSMGVDGDAVVDPRLKVHGIDGLRVIDASIMPVIVSGNTHAPTMMIGEKGAELIKEDWGLGSKRR